MILPVLLAATLAQAAPTTVQSSGDGWLGQRRPFVFVGAAAELGLASWAGPLSTSSTGPHSSIPSLQVGFSLEPADDATSWWKRHTSVQLSADLSGSSAGTSRGLAIGGRFIALGTRASPLLGYDLGVRYTSFPGQLPGLGVELLPCAGVQLKTSAAWVRFEIGPHLLKSFTSDDQQWWRARLTVSLPL